MSGQRKKVLWITHTAIFTALLVMAQFVTATFGNQYVTGSAVNLILIISVMVCGTAAGVTVGVVSPVFAFVIGVGPVFPPLIPFIALGNAAFVLAWHGLGRLRESGGNESPGKPGILQKTVFFITPAAAACVKFFTLYVSVVSIAVPYLFALGEAQSAALTLMFSYPQLITAATGGYIALAVIPRLQKALRKR